MKSVAETRLSENGQFGGMNADETAPAGAAETGWNAVRQLHGAAAICDGERTNDRLHQKQITAAPGLWRPLNRIEEAVAGPTLVVLKVADGDHEPFIADVHVAFDFNPRTVGTEALIAVSDLCPAHAGKRHFGSLERSLADTFLDRRRLAAGFCNVSRDPGFHIIGFVRDHRLEKISGPKISGCAAARICELRDPALNNFGPFVETLRFTRKLGGKLGRLDVTPPVLLRRAASRQDGNWQKEI